MILRKRGLLLNPGGRCVWVGHRPGQARLWMGVGAIVTFGSISGSVSSDEYKDHNCMLAHMRRVMPARDPDTGGAKRPPP